MMVVEIAPIRATANIAQKFNLSVGAFVLIAALDFRSTKRRILKNFTVTAARMGRTKSQYRPGRFRCETRVAAM